jgi:transcriptional regulator with PAS, ATPase and Fis domain
MNARIIGATHMHLGRAVAEGRFREDLYYRLRTIPIMLPPLRDRREDIPFLAAHFIRKLNARYRKNVRSIDPKIFRMFSGYRWPGNVRELERFIEHAFVFVKGPVIFAHHLPSFEGSEEDGPSMASAPEASGEREERNAVLSALSRAGGGRSEAAALLGISRTSMWRRMKALGITRKDLDAMKKGRTCPGH